MEIFVGIIMGSQFDWLIMCEVVLIFDVFGIVYEIRIVSVYCMFDWLWDYGKIVVLCGLKVIIVGVGGVVYLLGMMVLKMWVLVIGVLVQIKVLLGVDLLYLILQMFKGYFVVIMVIGVVGVVNVGLMVVGIFVVSDFVLVECLDVWCQVLFDFILQELKDD